MHRDDPVTQRLRAIYRRVHTGHRACLADEWLNKPCPAPVGGIARPIVWSRRNGPWRQVDVLLVGAAPGNAGGRGSGELGAHATRIPFGGDLAGGNLDVLLGAAGLNRNEVFIAAVLNQLPARGGGEPSFHEIRQPVGAYPSSLHLLRDTLLATGPRLVVVLGNLALRATLAATRLEADGLRLPSLSRIVAAGVSRGVWRPWPKAWLPDAAFLQAWSQAWSGRALPALLWLTHPSAQNMSPYAGKDTAFYTRMVAARDALQTAVREVLGRSVPHERPPWPKQGIYALPEWQERVGPRHAELDRLWHEKGV